MPNESNPLDKAAFEALFKYTPETVAGKGVIVTGGTTGLGRAIALLLVSRGAKVLIFGRHGEELADAVNDIKRVGGGEIYGMVADVSRPADISAIFEKAEQSFGAVDILINNAGVAGSSVTDMDDAAWRGVIETNLMGVMACCKAAAQRMKARKSGFILNIGSMSAESRNEGSDVYVATKSGIRGFTDSLARQLNQDGIRVTLLEPGLVGSDMTVEKVPKSAQRATEHREKILRAEDIAVVVLHVLEMPERCSFSLLQVRPTQQAL